MAAEPHCCLVLTSPDKALKLRVVKHGGDLSVGFEGYPWHTHADLLLAEYETEVEEEALGWFIQDVVTGARQVVIRKKAGFVVDAWVDYRPGSLFYKDPFDDPYLEPDESLEVRQWYS